MAHAVPLPQLCNSKPPVCSDSSEEPQPYCNHFHPARQLGQASCFPPFPLHLETLTEEYSYFSELSFCSGWKKLLQGPCPPSWKVGSQMCLWSLLKAGGSLQEKKKKKSTCDVGRSGGGGSLTSTFQG